MTASAADDRFGSGLALHGDEGIVGAWGDDDMGLSSGAVYVFTRTATSWAEQQKLTASDAAAAEDYFGYIVSLSGETMLIGAYGGDDAGSDSGAADVFTRSATTWSEQQKLTASDGAADDNFGYGVALHGDTALIGAYGDDDAGSASGSVYFFTRNAAAWTERQKLTASDGGPDTAFGGRLALGADTALVGAWADNGAAAAGAAYVFTRNATNWSEQQKLAAGDSATGDLFGGTASLNADTAIIGAYGSGSTGAAYVFNRSAGTWTEAQKLTPSDGKAGDIFGLRVAMNEDMALIGAYGNDDVASDAGAAYLMALRLVDGEACTADVACASRHCVDAYCCDFACDGLCQTCNSPGLEGTCSLAPQGSPPASDCSGYLCNGELAGCPANCRSDSECTGDHYCQNALSCLPKAANGQECTGESACLSGHCIDGVCCTEACDEGCGSCVRAGTVGSCSPLEAGSPGAPSCAPYLCSGTATGCDPRCAEHHECALGNHCEDGSCLADGEQGTACSEDVACATGHCTDGICCVSDACGDYRCGPAGACESSCSSSAQCASGHSCNSLGQCEAQPESSGALGESGACRVTATFSATPTSPRWLGSFGLLAWLAAARRRRRN